MLSVTVYRHEKYNKFLITVENGCVVTEYVLYDFSIPELAQFIRELGNEI